MSYYGGTITVDGRNMITSLLTGETIELTRIVVGTGAIPDGVEPIDMKDLVEPVADATSSVPVVENGQLSMIVEYRNDLNGGLQTGFWLREFGIYARTDKSEEILLYYATLGDSPQPVNAYRDNRVDIRRYPITIALELDADVQVSYNPGSFITSEEAKELVSAMVNEAVENIGTSIRTDIVIPRDGWEWSTEEDDLAGGMDEYMYRISLPIDAVTKDMVPDVAVLKSSLPAAGRAGLCPTAETVNGAIIFWARRVPEEDISASVTLSCPGAGTTSSTGTSTYVLPVATATRLGGVKVGRGLRITDDGILYTPTSSDAVDEDDVANDDETGQMLDEVFPDEDVATDKETGDMLDDIFKDDGDGEN